MRAVIQRVSKAFVLINNNTFSKINNGLLVLLGIEETDTIDDVKWLSAKIAHLRIFPDTQRLMNLSVRDMDGEILVVSQFTLYASTKKGNRPSYIKAAKPEHAIPIYENFIATIKKDSGKPVKTGKFGAMMQLDLTNDGPVTIIIDTKRKE